jgi:hypothetical protein
MTECLQNVRLFPHQKSAIERMRALETDDVRTSENSSIRTSLGLYTEKPGAGKSYAMLVHLLEAPLVAAAPGRRDDVLNDDEDNRMRVLTSRTRSLCGNRVSETIHPVYPTSARVLPVNLVLVPPSTFVQWETYVRNLVGDADPRIKTYSRKINELQLRECMDDGTSASNLQVLIVDTGAYSSIMRRLNVSNRVFQRLIIDEADSIRGIKHFRLVDALFMWIITATPHTLSTSGCSMLAIRSLFFDSGRGRWDSDAMRLIRTHLQIRHEDEIVDAALCLPPPRTRLIRVMQSYLLRGIRNYLNPLALGALEACDHRGALLALGCSSADGDNGIIAALVAKLEREIGNLTQDIDRRREYGGVENDDNDEFSIEHLEFKIARRRASIQNIMQRVREGNCCPIGLDVIEHKAVTPCCQNAFEFGNIVCALSRSPVCPMCKTPIQVSHLVVSLAKTDAETNNSEAGPSEPLVPAPAIPEVVAMSKQEALHHELSTVLIADPNARVLVFSCFFSYTVNSVVNTVCQSAGIDCYVSHQSHIPPHVLNAYKDGQTRVMVLNAHSVGAGVNLESTTHVITMHHMREDLYTQVVGRAQRLGRVGQLEIVNIRFESE